jgi:Leucine Rich repeat
MAIVAKAVFEKAAGKTPALGQVLALDRYVSANRGLTALTGGGRLFLVTVRPPDEALWLVAVLENPEFSGSEWVAKQASAVPMTDLSPLKSQLTFENGKGLPATAGTLGMSLQTPRVLVASDVALLVAALGGALPAGTTPSVGAGAGAGATAKAGATTSAPVDPAAPFWDAVRAAPQDDAPKLALGAHWRQHGEPRGELVEIDLLLRNERLSRHRRLALRERRDELITAHADRWWPWKVSSRRQRAGFLCAVSSEASSFLQGSGKGAAALFSAEPVTELELTELDEDSIGELARAPWLAKVRRLALRGGIGDEGLETLLKSKHLSELVALNLSSSELSSEALGALGNKLPALAHLVLTNNPIGDDGARALAAWKHFGGLRTLYLTACELSEEGVGALLSPGKLTSLEKWTLAQNELGDGGAQAIARHAAQLGKLRYLELCDVGLRDAGTSALAAARLPALRHLDIRDNRGSYDPLIAAYGDAVLRG